MDRDSLFSLPHGFDQDLKLLLFSMTTRRVATGFLQVVRVIYFALLVFSPLTIGLLYYASFRPHAWKRTQKAV